MSFIDIAAIVGGVALEAGLDTALFEGASAGLGALVEGGITGSALGAATSAITGQDVGKGALFGGLGGAITGGLGSAFGGSSGATAAAAPKAAGAMANEVTAAETPLMSVGQSGMTMPTTVGDEMTSQLESQVANANEAVQGLSGVKPPVEAPVAPSAGAPSLFDKTNPYRMSIDKQLGNTLYGQHKFMVPGVGAMLGSYLGGSDSSTSQATPPGGPSGGYNPLSWYKFNPRTFRDQPSGYTGYLYGNPGYAEGGIASLASPAKPASDSVDFMGGDMYPTSQQNKSFYATPSQMPTSAQQAMASYEPKTNPLTGEEMIGMAHGGIADLGRYSDGGRLTKGPGDGMSDDIPANIAGKQPARLAQGEFVVPADVVSHLGNGSTDAGAKQLYAMMDKVRKARTGRKSQGKQINPRHMMPV